MFRGQRAACFWSMACWELQYCPCLTGQDTAKEEKELYGPVKVDFGSLARQIASAAGSSTSDARETPSVPHDWGRFACETDQCRGNVAFLQSRGSKPQGWLAGKIMLNDINDSIVTAASEMIVRTVVPPCGPGGFVSKRGRSWSEERHILRAL